MNRSLASSIALFLIYCMVLTPCLNAVPLGGQSNEPAQQPPIVLSNAVTSAATVSVVSFINKIKDGTAEASDVQGAIVALGTFYAHMQETGMNDQIQRDILSREDEIVNSAPSEERIQELHAKIRASGAKVELNEIRNSLLTTQKDRQDFIAKIKKIGILGIEKEQLAALQGIQQSMRSNVSLHPYTSQSSVYTFYRSGFNNAAYAPHARLMRVTCMPAKLALGCFILMCASPPPVDAVMAIGVVIFVGVAAFAC